MARMVRAQARAKASSSTSARASRRCATSSPPTRSSATARAISRAGGTATGTMAPQPTQLAPTSGTMGYGLPAAVAAALRFKDRTVVCVAGDGDFLMNGQELATAAQYGADLLVILVDNGSYGTIRMHQERDYPKRISATDLANPDFAKLAEAYGGWAETRRDDRRLRPRARPGDGAQGHPPDPLHHRRRGDQQRRRRSRRCASARNQAPSPSWSIGSSRRLRGRLPRPVQRLAVTSCSCRRTAENCGRRSAQCRQLAFWRDRNPVTHRCSFRVPVNSLGPTRSCSPNRVRYVSSLLGPDQRHEAHRAQVLAVDPAVAALGQLDQRLDRSARRPASPAARRASTARPAPAGHGCRWPRRGSRRTAPPRASRGCRRLRRSGHCRSPAAPSARAASSRQVMMALDRDRRSRAICPITAAA